MNYNQSSYYRAHPYYRLGNLPPGAFKNRKQPDYMVQLPQGRQYFDPTTKKHFHEGYPSTYQVVKDPIHNHSPIERQALQRSYFRSLNAKDIEGATTNTLISKAVKNKMKAQQQLLRKKQSEEQERYMERMREQELQQYRSRVIEEYHQPNKEKQKKINYHERQRTQSSNPQQSNVREESYHLGRSSQLMKKAQKQMVYQPYSIRNSEQIMPITSQPEHNYHEEELRRPQETRQQGRREEIDRNYHQQQIRRRYQDRRSAQLPSQNPRFQSREQVRRHNPTYLSYGSPSFKIAGRNVIGY